jgi:putative PIN family toxin of toxin-antitoxin system
VAKPTVIVDTNVYVSAMLGSRTARRALRAIVNNRCQWFVSPELIQELSDVPLRPKFEGIIAPRLVKGVLDQLKSHAQLVHPKTSVQVCRDPRDNHVLAAALDSHATHLITGDKDLLALKSFRQTQIITSSVFLNELTS